MGIWNNCPGEASNPQSIQSIHTVHRRRHWVTPEMMSIRNAFFALALVLSAPGFAAVTAGTDYRTIDPPQHPESVGKIEVLEFFSYGCPHCNEFYPMVSAWSAKARLA